LKYLRHERWERERERDMGRPTDGWLEHRLSDRDFEAQGINYT
jgi:hypothetical protein